MKKLFALLTALSMLLLVSCGETEGTTSQTPSNTNPTSSQTVSEAGKEYEKPEEVLREGTDIGVFEGERFSAAVCPDFIDSVNSLDSYTCKAFAMYDGLIVVCYTYSVCTMPNYYEPRVAVGCFPHFPSGATIPGEDSWDGLIETEELPGYMNTYLVSGGYLAVASDSENIRVYSLKTGKPELVKSYKGSGVALLDFKADGDKLYPLYTDGDGVKLGDNKVNSPIAKPTVGAVSQSGGLVALSDGKTGAMVNTLTGATVKKDIDLTALDNRVSVYANEERVLFLGKVAGGNAALTAVTLTASGEEKTYEHLFDDFFADTYARGTVTEGEDGTLYLVSSRTDGNFGFGDALIRPIGDDMTLGEPLYTLEKGWHPYFAYTFGSEFVFTENLADGAEVKDYIHLF